MARRALILLVAVALAGCGEKLDNRTGPKTMDVEMSRAFKRAYAGAFRMRTDRADRDAARHAVVRCRPTATQPDADREAWPWFCRVLWFVRDRPGGHVATYGVKVESRGCFEARSGDFPRRLPERVLDGRSARNPLVYFRSCP
jgi:hypothetical protein